MSIARARHLDGARSVVMTGLDERAAAADLGGQAILDFLDDSHARAALRQPRAHRRPDGQDADAV
jgi:hypothetical protein